MEFPFHIYNTLAKKGEIKMERMNLFGGNNKTLLPAPIQDGDGNLTFSLEEKAYSLNVNSEEEREKVKREVNANSLTKYNWFKEETGENHWVLYNIEMYGVLRIDSIECLRYKEYSGLTPIIPINATSCHSMFYDCPSLTSLDLSSFDTSKVTTMYCMFYGCKKLTSIYISDKWKTNKVTEDVAMFDRCCSLPNFNKEKTDAEMAKPIEQGGYLTLKK